MPELGTLGSVRGVLSNEHPYRDQLIGATTTKTGLKVECALDERTYQKGIRIKKAEMKLLDIEGEAFHPEWNYTIKPRIPREP